MTLQMSWLWFVMPLGFAAFWCVIIVLISFASGWQNLARYFRAVSKPAGQVFVLQTCSINGADYKGALNFVVAEEGLYLAVLPIFRMGHAPLLIPWTAISEFETRKIFWVSRRETTISVSQFNRVRLLIYNQQLISAIEEQRRRVAAEPQAFSTI